MSEQKRISVYEFDFTIMLFLAFVGILIKIMFENTSLKNSNVGTASASIIGYSLVIISVISLLFVQIALAKGDSFDELYEESDVVSLHMDYNPTTEYMIDNKFLSNFRKSIG